MRLQVAGYLPRRQPIAVYVRTESVGGREVIRDTAPITRRFVGQPLDNLVRWLRRNGQVDVFDLDETTGG